MPTAKRSSVRDAAVTSEPVADLSSLPTSGTAPLPVAFDGAASSGPATGWNLNFGDGTPDATGTGLPPSPTATHTYKSAGVFTSTLVVSNGSASTMAQSTVTVNNPAPAPPLARLGVTAGSGVAPLSVAFDGSASHASQGSLASWTLSFGDATAQQSGTGTPPASVPHVFSSSGSYTATLTVTDSTGLTGSSTAQVSVGAGTATQPIAALGTDVGAGVAPLSATLDGSGSSDSTGSIVAWDLSFGDGSPDATGSGPPPSPTATHSYATPGTYQVELSVTDSTGSTGTATMTEVVQAPPPQADLTATPGSAGQGIHKIQHVVVIMQENRSFDNYFGTYPGADGIPMHDGKPTVCIPDPSLGHCVSPYHDSQDVNLGGPHGANSFATDLDGGKMDGFIATTEKAEKPACGTVPCAPPGGQTDVMGYHNAGEIPNYWDYAKNFVLQDHMFESNTGWSLNAHLGLVSLWSAKCSQAHNPMSCTSSLNAGSNPNTDFPWTDLTWLLHAYGVSWRYYLGVGSQPDCDNNGVNCAQNPMTSNVLSIWNPLPQFDDVSADGQLGNITSTSSFYTAARNGTLPSVSWIVPSLAVSEHAPQAVSAGQAYVTGLINSIMEGPDWGSTAIFLTWDDWGGFYDNVVPPQVDTLGYGFRVPGVLISPYAKRGYIDHQQLSSDAYAKFIEDDFLGGARLDPATDGRPDSRPDVRENEPGLGNLANDFNFSQAPAAPVVLKSGPPWGAVPANGSTPTTSTGTAPLAVSFDGSGSTAPLGSIASWRLSFGDGSADATGTGAPPSPTLTHTYSQPGTYSAALEITGADDQTSTSTLTITVKSSPPTVSLTGSAAVLKAPAVTEGFSSAVLSDPAGSIASWDLSYGDGTTDATGSGAPPATLPSHSYPVSGDYPATLTVTDGLGDQASSSFSVNVESSVAVTPSVLTVPTSVTVTSPGGFFPGENVDIDISLGTTAAHPTKIGTTTADASGTVNASVSISPAFQSGTYQVTIVGEKSGTTTSTPLSIYTNWLEFGFSPSHGGFNPYESRIGPKNASLLQSAGWWGQSRNAVTSPAVFDDRVTVGSRDRNVYTWDAKLWTDIFQYHTSQPIVSSPVVDTQNGYIYTASTDGTISFMEDQCIGRAFEPSVCTTGVLINLGTAVESSPAIENGIMYVGGDNGVLYAVDIHTRSVLWSLQTGGKIYSSPAVANGTVVVGSEDEHIYVANAQTGALDYSYAVGSRVDSSPAIDGTTAYVGTRTGYLYAVSLACTVSCKPLWRTKTGGPVVSSPAVANGRIFVGSDDGKLYALTESNGKVSWTVTTGGGVESSPSVANGLVYFGSDDGRIYVANAAGCGSTSCSPLWSSLTGGAITSEPAVADGRVFVGSSDGKVYVYDLPHG